MIRRLHVPQVRAGDLQLPPGEAHHARAVLRLRAGDGVELFDDAGHSADATIVHCTPDAVRVRVEQVRPPAERTLSLTVAAAIPKGTRADWMIEKLSEIGVDRFIPLATARAVVLPEGKNKPDRWMRLAAEAAKQSRRSGVMSIDPLTDVQRLITHFRAPHVPGSTPSTAFYCSTAPDARPLAHLLQAPPPGQILLLIGPEGGWTPEEVAAFDAAAIEPLSLTSTVLRIETAALLGAGALLSLLKGA